MKLPNFLLILCSFSSALIASERMEISRLPDLPPLAGTEENLGLASPYFGHHKGHIILAGGANFPDGLPWETRSDGSASPKVYYDDIYTKPFGEESWQISKTTLPIPLGYGGSVSHPTLGLICIGGENKTPTRETPQQLNRSANVFSISIQPDGKVSIDSDFPPLPVATTNLTAALDGDMLYAVCGGTEQGSTNQVYSLDLSDPEDRENLVWQELPPIPGSPRQLPVASVQSDGKENRLYVFSGRAPGPKSVDLLTDTWSYSPSTRIWERKRDLPRVAMAASAAPAGTAHVLIFGGDDGVLFQQLEYDLPQAIEKASTSEEKQKLEQERLRILTETHPGFSRDILSYHTITDQWVTAGEVPSDLICPACTAAFEHEGQFYLSTGEKSPGIRTPQVLQLSFPDTRAAFGFLNYAVMGLYLIGILINGFWFARKMKSTDDFFKAGGRIPWWAAGLSIFGTQLSAMTFIAVPAKAYATDWTLLVGQFSILLVAPFIIAWFLPFYRRLNVTTAYEYLERRFHVATRCFGSVLFICLQLARIGIVLFLPSLVLSIVTGMGVTSCILLMGILCLIYSTSGGMEAVVWTDVTQVIILLVGAVACLVVVPMKIDGGWNAMVAAADAADKFKFFDFRLDFASTAFFVVVLGTITQNFISYGTDQSVIQRYLTTADEKESRRSIWTNAILAIPASFLFFGLGAALYAYYSLNPTLLDPMMEKPEAILPLFLVENLPVGLSGLVIAAIFAASMSSVDSAMNSVSAAVTTDFYQRFRTSATAQSSLRVARIATFAVGILGISLALLFAHTDVQSIWDQFAFFLGLFGGALAGLFVLGIFTRRANATGAAVGLVASAALQWFLTTNGLVSSWFFAFTGIASCVSIGWLASLAFRRATAEELQGLTLRTQRIAGE